MKNLFLVFIGLFSMILIACNSSSQQSAEDEGLTPVTPADQHRYNIDAATEEVINLDTTHMDSTQLEIDPE